MTNDIQFSKIVWVIFFHWKHFVNTQNISFTEFGNFGAATLYDTILFDHIQEHLTHQLKSLGKLTLFKGADEEQHDNFIMFSYTTHTIYILEGIRASKPAHKLPLNFQWATIRRIFLLWKRQQGLKIWQINYSFNEE